MISAQTARRRPVSVVLHQTQTAEVHLRHLAGCALSHPDRRGTMNSTTCTRPDPGPQAALGCGSPATGRRSASRPGPPRGQDLLGRYLHLPGARNTHPRSAAQQHRRVSDPPPRPLDVRALLRQPRTRCYLPLAHARLPAPHYFLLSPLSTPPCTPSLLLTSKMQQWSPAHRGGQGSGL